MASDLVDWVNTQGPPILDRMYDMLPLMVFSAVSVALIVYWALGGRPHRLDEPRRWSWRRLRSRGRRLSRD